MKSTWQLWLNDKVSAGLGNITGMTDQAAKGFLNVQTGINDFSKVSSGALDAIGSQVPQIGNALSMLSSPIGALGVGIAATAGLLYKAGEAAAEFDSQFLELRQLNLDKPVAELERLNDRILENSFNNGLNAKATAKAYFDIQSATGKYGEEVDSIVAKTGEFARVTKADMDSSIQGVAKSINAFGLDAQQMDKYFASSFKTVQVGITTFDQLAEVQTDYAGAAAAAGQGFDDANKLFATFTTTAKSVNEAATLTKTAFQDITKKSTIDGFAKIGVNVFDAAGKMRSFDAITRDLVPRLGKLNDLQFAALKEEIGGSEGIRGYLDKVKGSGESVITLLDTFDNTTFNIDTAIKNANGDFRIMAQLLNDKVNTGMVKLGQTFLPTINEQLLIMVDGIDRAVSKWGELNTEGSIMSGIIEGFAWAWDTGLKGWALVHDNIFNVAKGIIDAFTWIERAGTKVFSAIGMAAKGEFMAAAKELQGIGSIWDEIQAGAKTTIAAKATGKAATGLGATPPKGKITGGATEDASAAVSAGINSIAGGGQMVRNITVNISKMVESINIHTTETRQELGDIERKIEEYLIRAINGAEMAVSNG